MRLFYILFAFFIFYPLLKALGRILKMSLSSLNRRSKCRGPAVDRGKNGFGISSPDSTLRKQKIVDAEFKEIPS